MSGFERDLIRWLEGKVGMDDLESAYGAEARQVVALHMQLSDAPAPPLPAFSKIAAALEPRSIGFIEHMQMRLQRPIAVAMGTVLMTGGAAYATIEPVRSAVNDAVEQVGEALGLIDEPETEPVGGNDRGPLDDPGGVIVDDPARRDDEPLDDEEDDGGDGRGSKGDGGRDRAHDVRPTDPGDENSGASDELPDPDDQSADTDDTEDTATETDDDTPGKDPANGSGDGPGSDRQEAEDGPEDEDGPGDEDDSDDTDPVENDLGDTDPIEGPASGGHGG